MVIGISGPDPSYQDFEDEYRQIWGDTPDEDYEETSKANMMFGLYAQQNPDWEGYDHFSQFIPGGGDDSGDSGGGGSGSSGGGSGGTGSTLWNIPASPDIYSVPGLPGLPQLPTIYNVPERYDVGSYNIPSKQSLMPYEGWYKDIDQGLRDYVWEPYQEGSEKLARELAGVGMYGSQKAGMSGAAADVFKDYNIDASQEVAKSLWDMTYPGMEKYFDTSTQQARDIWGADVTSKQDYWKGQLGAAQDEYGTKVKAWGTQADREMTGWDALLGQSKDEWKGNWGLYEDYLDRNKWPYSNLLSYLQEAMADIFTGYGDEEPTVY